MATPKPIHMLTARARFVNNKQRTIVVRKLVGPRDGPAWTSPDTAVFLTQSYCTMTMLYIVALSFKDSIPSAFFFVYYPIICALLETF